jgi:hypothetical protein
MSLLKELDPRVRELLNADKEQYPHSTQHMIDNLQSAYVIGDLTVNTATNLLNYAEKAKVVFNNQNSFVLKLYQIFGK